MTLLSIIQDMCDELALDRPMTVVGNNDQLTREMLGSLNAAGRMLSHEADPSWAGLTRFATFTSVAGELQGALTTFAPDYGFTISDTLWDGDSAWPTTSAITPQMWAWMQIRGGIAPYGNTRILVDPATNKLSLYVNPAPAAGNTYTFEYISKMWVISPNTNPVTQMNTFNGFQTDNDTVFYDEDMLKAQAIWRFKRTKGIEDWQIWKIDADSYKDTIKTQEIGTPSFYIGGRYGYHLVNYNNVQDGNYPA